MVPWFALLVLSLFVKAEDYIVPSQDDMPFRATNPKLQTSVNANNRRLVTEAELADMRAKDPNLRVFKNTPMFGLKQLIETGSSSTSQIPSLSSSGKHSNIMFIDSSFDPHHPSVIGRIGPQSFDFKANTSEIDGEITTEPSHGLIAMGIAGGTKFPKTSATECAHGVAYEATLSGRIAVFEGTTIDILSRALSSRIEDITVMNNSWGFDLCTKLGCAMSPRLGIESSIKYAAEYGRGGKGIAIVFGAGNDGQTVGADTNLCPLTRDENVITVASVNGNMQPSTFSNKGKSVFIAAIGEGLPAPISELKYGSTEPTHSCTDNYQGTSAAAAVASGVIGAILSEYPGLTLYDLKQILARSATANTSMASCGWKKNSAGVSYSEKVGFGIIDGEKALALAKNWPAGSTYTKISAPIYGILNPDGTINTVLGADQQIEKNTSMTLVYKFSEDQAVRLESMIFSFANGAQGGYTISIGNSLDDMRQLISVPQSEGPADGLMDTIDLLTYEFFDVLSVGQWYIRIDAMERMTVNLNQMQLFAKGLKVDVRLDEIELISTDKNTIQLSTESLNNQELKFNFPNGVYVYLNVNNKLIQATKNGAPVVVDIITEKKILVDWDRSYGCGAVQTVQIVLVNTMNNTKPIACWTSDTLVSSTLQVNGKNLCSVITPEEEQKPEEEVPPEEEQKPEEEVTPLPPEEEEEQPVPPTEEEECPPEEEVTPPIVEEEEEVVKPEEECPPIVPEEEVPVVPEEEIINPWPEEECPPEEEEACPPEEEVGPPVYPPEEEISDGFTPNSTAAKMLALGLAAAIAFLI